MEEVFRRQCPGRRRCVRVCAVSAPEAHYNGGSHVRVKGGGVPGQDSPDWSLWMQKVIGNSKLEIKGHQL